MRWASLEEWRGRFAISHHLHLPALLDRTHALLRSTAHHLHNDESEKNEADVANHRLIHPALARLQSRILLGVAEKRLDGPATHLAQNHRGEVRPQVVCDDVVVVAVTVSGHDQPQGTVLRSVDVEGYRAHPEVLSPLQSQRPGQLAHAATLGAPEDDRPRMERTDPHQPQPSHHLGEPPGAVVGVEDDVASFEPRAYDLLEHLFGELELGLVGVRSARAFGSPQPESHRYTKPLAVADAPQKHHHVQPVDLALFGEGVGPSCPRKLFGERLLDHAVVQTQVALPTMALARVDQESHQLPGGEGRHPQEPVESVVAAAGQEERHACLRLALVEQDQSAYVERDQHERGGAAKHADAEAIQHESDLGGQRTGGTIQSGRHGETSAGSDWFGQTSSYPVVTSLGFRADQSPYRVSPVNKSLPTNAKQRSHHVSNHHYAGHPRRALPCAGPSRPPSRRRCGWCRRAAQMRLPGPPAWLSPYNPGSPPPRGTRPPPPPCPRAADGTQPQILLKLEVPSVLSTGLRFLFNIYREIVASPARTAGRRSRRDVLGDVFGVSSHTPDQGGGKRVQE